MMGAMLAVFKKYLPLFFVLSTLFLLISILNPSGNVYPPSSIPLADTTPSAAELKTYYKVTKVIDGDTLDVLIDGKSERIRLIGIDTPETLDPRKPVQCFGTEATNKSKEILTDQQVYLEIDLTQGDRDKYGRLLRHVFLQDGTNFAEKMIAEGYGHEYTYNTPYKYQAEFQLAEKLASTNNLGLWSANTCAGDTTSALTPIILTLPSASSGSYTCDCSKVCAAMSSCAEAQYQLNNCGCAARDADKDGIACDVDCQ